MYKKKIILSVVIPPLLILLLFILFLYRKPLVIKPTDSAYAYDVSSDSKENLGTTMTSAKLIDTALHFNYRLSPEIQYPYALLRIFPFEFSGFMDISGYDYLDYTVSQKGEYGINVQLYYYIPNFSKPEKGATYKPFGALGKATSQSMSHRITLNQMKTPVWWYRLVNSVPENFDAKPPLDKVSFIGLGNLPNLPRDKDISTTIYDIRFVKDLRHEIMLLVVLILLYELSFFLLCKKYQEKKLFYQKNSLTSYDAEKAQKLIRYLGQHFADTSLSLEKIEAEIGIKSHQVNEILMDHFSLLYKQYLTHIRIVEAKRLLTETNRQITDIAHCVGFIYSSSFTRAFRKSENLSPNEYRTEQKQR